MSPPADTLTASDSAAGPRAEAAIASWRRSILDAALVLATVIFALVLLTTALQGGAPGRKLAAMLSPGCAMVVAGLLWRSGPLQARAFLMLGGYWAGVAAAGLARGPGIPNPWVGALFVCVLAALVLERHLAWVATAVTSTVWIGVAVWWTRGSALPDDSFADPTDAGNWVRLILIFGLFSFAAVEGVLFLVSRLERTLVRSEKLVDALQEESTQRLREQQERHALEVRLRQSQRLEALGTLAGSVAHDVNNLLQVMSANAELAIDERDPVRREEARHDLRTASARAADLTRQLLTFSRERSADIGAIDVAAAIDEALKLVRPLVPDVDLHLDPSPEPLPPVRGSAPSVQQIVMNLVLNARDAMPHGGSIQLQTRRVDPSPDGPSFVRLRVRDEGQGMDPDTLDRICDPFFTTKTGGTGLGLHLVKSIAHDSGGTVEVRSQPGQGTTFDVFLGLADDDLLAPETVPRAQAPRRGEGRRVLVVDDDDLVRRTIVRSLRAVGYEVVEHGDGDSATAAFAADPKGFDLVVCDALMPRMGGRAVFEAIHALRPGVPFLVCSGYTADVFEPGFFELPTRRFVAKPFQRRDFLRHVAELAAAGRP